MYLRDLDYFSIIMGISLAISFERFSWYAPAGLRRGVRLESYVHVSHNIGGRCI